MQHLTPVGLSKDGTLLVLVSTSGVEYAVPVDTRLRAALRGENARLGQLEMKMESALRPRDIQARIRSGESPEDVAAAAQTTVEAIMGFAGPVLAERAHIAQNAQRASVRRRTNEAAASARTLGEAAEAYFSTYSLHDEDLDWDSWRRPDGRWAVVVAYALEGRDRRAEFTHDVAGRYVVADNDEARLLTGELRATESRSPRDRDAAPVRRLSTVPDQDELPLGDDAIELVREPREAGDDLGAGPESQQSGKSDPDTGQPGRESGRESGRRPGVPLSAQPDPIGETADADWMAAAPVDGAAPVDEPVDEPAESARATDSELPADEPDGGADPADEAADGEDPQPEPQPSLLEEKAERQPAKKKGRSSVPSWDEIMFGGGKND